MTSERGWFSRQRRRGHARESKWSKLVLQAFEPDKKVVYASAYAFPLEILAAFETSGGR